MTQLEFVLNEIKSNGNLLPAQLAQLATLFAQHDKRMHQKYPFYDLFITGTGQSYGLTIQQKIIESFNDLTKHEGDSTYDADCHPTQEKIEIKSIKAITKQKDTYIGGRIINYKDDNTACGSSFQQVKPTACDWFILHILFGNKERLFLVPSRVVSEHPKNPQPHKIPMSAQHRNHSTEGQINSGQILRLAPFFEIKDYSHQTPKKYSFENLKNEITARLKAVGWQLPN